MVSWIRYETSTVCPTTRKIYLHKPEVVSRRNHRPRHPKLFRPSDSRNEWLRLLPPDIARSGFSSFSVASPASTASRPNLDSQIYTQLLILLPDASSPPPTFLPDPDALSPAGVASAASASSPAATTMVAATALLLLCNTQKFLPQMSN